MQRRDVVLVRGGAEGAGEGAGGAGGRVCGVLGARGASSAALRVRQERLTGRRPAAPETEATAGCSFQETSQDERGASASEAAALQRTRADSSQRQSPRGDVKCEGGRAPGLSSRRGPVQGVKGTQDCSFG